jgi:hypothetical protein
MKKIAVFAVKGGVGKSTVSAGLCRGLTELGFYDHVGYLEIDISGTSGHRAFGMEAPRLGLDTESEKLIPPLINGIRMFPLASKFTESACVGWQSNDRVFKLSDGDEVNAKGRTDFIKAILTKVVDWKDTEWLVLDLPPSCLASSSFVYTTDGPKQITDVRVGDVVFSFEGDIHKRRKKGEPKKCWHFDAEVVRKKVVKIIPNGFDNVYALRTDGREIEVNTKHPFLAVEKTIKSIKSDGRNLHDYKLIWKQLCELKVDDYIVILKEIPGNNQFHPIPGISGVNTRDFMRLVGYYLGDGFIHKNGKYLDGVWFCEPRNGKYRAKYVELLKKLFKLKVAEYDDQYGVISAKVARMFDSLQLGHGALNKRIPSWVFTMPFKDRIALFEGFADADGHRRRGGNTTLNTSGEGLVNDLHALCIYSGLRVSNIMSRRCSSSIDGRLIESVGFSVEITIPKGPHPRVSGGTGVIRFGYGHGVDNKWFGIERIKSIKPAGRKEVFDVVLENNSNFVANGIPVHNSNEETFTFFECIPDLYGVVLVSQPSEIACVGLLKTIDFLKNEQVPVLGIVENMAACLCPFCNKEFYPFTSKGVDLKKLAKDRDIPYLLSIPQVDSMEKLEPYFLSLAKMVVAGPGKVVDQYVFSKRAQLKRSVVKTTLGFGARILPKKPKTHTKGYRLSGKTVGKILARVKRIFKR